jgi:hypothetical protein
MVDITAEATEGIPLTGYLGRCKWPAGATGLHSASVFCDSVNCDEDLVCRETHPGYFSPPAFTSPAVQPQMVCQFDDDDDGSYSASSSSSSSSY